MNYNKIIRMIFFFYCISLCFLVYSKDSENLAVIILDGIESSKLTRDVLKNIDPKSPDFDFTDALNRLHSERSFDKPSITNQFSLYKPYQEFVYFKNPFEESEFLTFKSNQTTFYNKDGFYHLNFSFEKNNSMVPVNKKAEILLILYTPNRFVPFYTYEHKIFFKAVGLNNRSLWETEFRFDFREACQEILKKGGVFFKLTKSLSNSDLEQLRNLFRSNRKVYFRIEAIEGSFDFIFDEDAVYFYRNFFEYAAKLNFY